VGGAGTVLNWDSCVGIFQSLYVSDRGLLTCEKEDVASIPIPYLVAETGTDDIGKFVIIVSD
jgi:hypothetical protein